MKTKTIPEAPQGTEDPPDQEAMYLVHQLMGIMDKSSYSAKDLPIIRGVAMNRLLEIKPKDSIERMLALQMIGTHEAAIACLRRAMLPDQTFDGRDLNLRHAVRLMSVFERQVAALDKHRGKGQQNVTVKYVHVAEGGQAIVGNVTRNGTAVREAEAPPALEAPTEMPLEIAPVRQKVRAR